MQRNPADARRRHRNHHRIGGEIASGFGLRNR
jgi:hypothetical protein